MKKLKSEGFPTDKVGRTNFLRTFGLSVPGDPEPWPPIRNSIGDFEAPESASQLDDT